MLDMKTLPALLLLALAVPACATDNDDGSTRDPSTGDPNGETQKHDGKVVFTTQARFQGSHLGGLAGADAKCAAAASAAGLGGTFKAWLSDLTGSPSERMTHATLPYELVTGVKIASDWADLTDGLLEHAIDRDEHGKPIVQSERFNGVWTATASDGLAITWQNTDVGTTSRPRFECGNWGTSTTPIGVAVGMLGGFETAELDWTQTNSGVFCDESMHLFCFEQ